MKPAISHENHNRTGNEETEYYLHKVSNYQRLRHILRSIKYPRKIWTLFVIFMLIDTYRLWLGVVKLQFMTMNAFYTIWDISRIYIWEIGTNVTAQSSFRRTTITQDCIKGSSNAGDSRFCVCRIYSSEFTIVNGRPENRNSITSKLKNRKKHPRIIQRISANFRNYHIFWFDMYSLFRFSGRPLFTLVKSNTETS